MVIRPSAASASSAVMRSLATKRSSELLDAGQAALERVVVDVAEHDVVPGGRGHLGDAGAHQSGPDDRDLGCHAHVLL